ncbi:MAG: UbiX family flavin prenyltransferase [Lachnospiraceae bacterium]|nr:UbiX family flavin prenyltransferase [Lachnospiraceae bacterium]
MAKRLVIGMSGASGAPLTVELLRQLHTFYPQVESHLVVTKGGEMTLRQETGMTPDDLQSLATVFYDNENIGAAIASGSFHTIGMVVVPCSMKTVAGIVSGYSDNLLLRAADVCLKERRKLVLVPREAPLSTLHLRNLYEASGLGAVILPPMQTYYDYPRTVEDMTKHTVGRILSQFGLGDQADGWTGML